MEQMEFRCKILEEKKTRLKQYKKMVNSSMFMICVHCQKTIATNIFLEHISSCKKTSHLQNNLNT